MEFKVGLCPKCGKMRKLSFSNNPLSGSPICFQCVNDQLDYNNITHGEFFCRTYNLPWNPELWIEVVREYKANVFEEYSKFMLDEQENKPNLAYESTTKDLWARTNSEWEKCRSFTEILERITPIKESYIDRGHLKWGEQYNFQELIRLDSIYGRTLKANNINNPLQKEAVKTLCKLQIEMDEAIRAKDAKAIKDFSSAWSTFAKQADLETMINETKTEDITTVAELYDYMERQGFVFKYYDNFPKDEIDQAIQDIQESNRRLILESTGLQQLLEDMMKKRIEQQEAQYTQEVYEKENLQDLLNFKAEDEEVATEDDAAVTELDFSDEDSGGSGDA